jgi:hypothetical protein
MHGSLGAGLGAALPGAAGNSPPPAPGGPAVELATPPAPGLPPVADVLRRAFPAWLSEKSPEYVEGFITVLLMNVGAQSAARATPFDRDVCRARETARGLAGIYVSAERGQA